MVNEKIKKDSEELLKNASKPDNDLSEIDSIISEIQEANQISKKKSKKDLAIEKEELAEYLSSANGFNVMLFTLTSMYFGTDAFPKAEKQKIMDKALTRYLQIKEIKTSPEIILITAYIGYIGELAKNDIIRKKVKEKIGNKFSWIKNKIGNKFKRKNKEKKENESS